MTMPTTWGVLLDTVMVTEELGVELVEVVRPQAGGVAPERAIVGFAVSGSHVMVRLPLNPAEELVVMLMVGLGENGSVRLV